jgi:RNA polymerase sigma-32 factor
VRYGKTHDQKIARKLITANLKLVVKLAHEYSRAHRNLLDLIQEGNVGLVQAVEKYDPNRGVKLSSYAAWWIRAYQWRYLLRNHRLVRLGTTEEQRRIYARIARLRARLEAAQLEPTPERLAAILAVTPDVVRSMEQRLDSREQSLDAPHAGSLRPLADALPAPELPADEQLMAREIEEIFHGERDRFRRTLDPRRRAIFDARWSGDKRQTFISLGARLGVSRERVHQLEQGMLQALRTRVEKRLAA